MKVQRGAFAMRVNGAPISDVRIIPTVGPPVGFGGIWKTAARFLWAAVASVPHPRRGWPPRAG